MTGRRRVLKSIQPSVGGKKDKKKGGSSTRFSLCTPVKSAAFSRGQLVRHLPGGDFAQGEYYVLVAPLVLDEGAGTLVVLLDAPRREHDEKKPVIYLIETIFYGNPCHNNSFEPKGRIICSEKTPTGNGEPGRCGNVPQ